MAIKSSNNNVAYGLNNALQNLAPIAILAKRAPTSADLGQIGQQWIYNNLIWELTSSATWTQIVTDSGSGTFTALTVNGISLLNGATTVTGATILNGSVTAGNTTAGTAISLAAGATGGVIINANGSGNVSLVSSKVAATSAAYTATNNGLIGSCTFIGLTLAQNASHAFVITNSNITTTSHVMMSVVNNNVSTGAALLAITGTTLTTNTLTVEIINNGGAAGLGTTDSVIISFIILG